MGKYLSPPISKGLLCIILSPEGGEKFLLGSFPQAVNSQGENGAPGIKYLWNKAFQYWGLIIKYPYQTVAEGIQDDLGAVDQVEFAENISDMHIDRSFADDQFFGNFIVGQAPGNQF